LQDKVLEQAAHVIVGKGGADGGLHAEAAAQTAGHVVFPAAFPHFEFTRRADAAFTRIETKHDFAERDHVIGAGTGGFDGESGHGWIVACSSVLR
jgi:hypothetical protein